jgi:hypothetical protein
MIFTQDTKEKLRVRGNAASVLIQTFFSSLNASIYVIFHTNSDCLSLLLVSSDTLGRRWAFSSHN